MPRSATGGKRMEEPSGKKRLANIARWGEKGFLVLKISGAGAAEADSIPRGIRRVDPNRLSADIRDLSYRDSARDRWEGRAEGNDLEFLAVFLVLFHHALVRPIDNGRDDDRQESILERQIENRSTA